MPAVTHKVALEPSRRHRVRAVGCGGSLDLQENVVMKGWRRLFQKAHSQTLQRSAAFPVYSERPEHIGWCVATGYFWDAGPYTPCDGEFR